MAWNNPACKRLQVVLKITHAYIRWWAYINVGSIDVTVGRVCMGRDGMQSDTMIIICVARNKG